MNRRLLTLTPLLVVLASVVAADAFAQHREKTPCDDVCCVQGVHLRLVGNVARDIALADSIVSWFRPELRRCQRKGGLTVEAASTLEASELLEPAQQPGLWIWVSFQPEEPSEQQLTAFLVLMPQDGQPRRLVRRLLLEEGLDELAREEVAQMIASLADALLAGRQESSLEEVQETLGRQVETPHPQGRNQTAKPVREPPRSEPAIVPVESARDSRLLVGYHLALRGDEGWSHGPDLGLAWHFSERWTWMAQFRARLPATARLPPVQLKTWGAGGLTGVGYEFWQTSSLSITMHATLGLEAIRYSAASAESDWIGRGGWDFRPAVGLAAGITFPNPWAPSVALQAEALLVASPYEVRDIEQIRQIGRPSFISPVLYLYWSF